MLSDIEIAQDAEVWPIEKSPIRLDLKNRNGNRMAGIKPKSHWDMNMIMIHWVS
ncbi:Uncharacterised protein [Weissella viridescens]|uniref:Uncharacterized protein n=1 Tax=Weissella viridescens TaxID=1629 RepID=A0A380P149_WEIVI|nr:Uncharacterised protein [Weissella viridescens]